jgi:hypothetical protein
MKTDSQIRQQLKQVIFRHLQKMLRNNFKRVSNNCIYNKPRESKGIIQSEFVGICKHSSTGRIGEVLCDSRIPFCADVVKGCVYFAPQKKEELKDRFKGMLEGDRGELALSYPDIAALMWVLDSDSELVDWLTGDLPDEQLIVGD